MKPFMNRYLRVFAIVTLLNLVLAVIINRRFNNEVAYPIITVASALIALCFTGSGFIFRRSKGNPLFNTFFGFLVILPVVFILWRAYGIYLFKYSAVIYLVCFVIGIIYAIAVIVVSAKAKKEAADLNTLLQKSQAKKPEEL